MAEISGKRLKTLQDILKEQGVTDEAVTKITGSLKDNSIFLSSGEDIDTKYRTLRTENEKNIKELSDLRKANEDLRKSNEELTKASTERDTLKESISTYETKLSDLEGRLKSQTLDSALKIAALSSGAQDPDYIAYKLSGGGSLELDDDGNVKGIDEMIESLKKSHPSQFTTAKETIIPAKLSTEESQPVPGVTKDQFGRMSYSERLELYKADPETYKTLTGKTQE